ncbi:DNA recombination protein RmuC [Devosia sp. CN2-171]|uniref:DNA recombination protein RmuC n=1 Tax=Devosia sp. CN2-171 TaxID=3400909 RepID=UPI003BF7C416
MDRVLFVVADFPVTLEIAAYAAAGLFTALLVALLVVVVRQSRQRAEEARQRAEEAEALRLKSAENERHLADMIRIQSEMTGRMQTMSEIFGSRTSDLARLVNDRLDSQGQRIGAAMSESSTKTNESLAKLQERLAVIDRAQSNIAQLSQNVVSLQSILANKQTRGAFGQGRMEAILGDGLAQNAYAFQATLSNGSRPDALVYMPNNAPSLVIDAKFPLESWQRFTAAAEGEDPRFAASGFRNDMGVHIKAISEKYLIAGETADTAFLFVPSESIFADLHEHFEDVVQRALKARVVIVSPSILMLSIQVVQALLRDVRMREEAYRIQTEVRALLGDVGRLDERVRKLQTHFTQASNDIGDIVTSSNKVMRRGERIEAMEFDEARPEPQRLAGE